MPGLAALPRLTELDLTRCKISVLGGLARHHALEQLLLGGTLVEDEAIQELGLTPQLHYVELTHCHTSFKVEGLLASARLRQYSKKFKLIGHDGELVVPKEAASPRSRGGLKEAASPRGVPKASPLCGELGMSVRELTPATEGSRVSVRRISAERSADGRERRVYTADALRGLAKHPMAQTRLRSMPAVYGCTTAPQLSTLDPNVRVFVPSAS